MDTSKIPSAFISYAHDTTEHEKNVLNFSNKLCYHYINCNCDQYVEDGNPKRGWPNWMEENLRVSNFVLVVVSEKYLERLENRAPVGSGLGAKWEAMLTANEIYQNGAVNSKYIPIILHENDKKYIPTFLQSYTHYNISKSSDFVDLLKRMRGELKNRKPKLGPADDETFTDSLTLPILPQFTTDMKPAMKILQAFFVLPVSNRFKIASDLGLVEEGETVNEKNLDELSGKFLIRAKERNLLSDLWSKLFDEKLDPNPFK